MFDHKQRTLLVTRKHHRRHCYQNFQHSSRRDANTAAFRTQKLLEKKWNQTLQVHIWRCSNSKYCCYTFIWRFPAAFIKIGRLAPTFSRISLIVDLVIQGHYIKLSTMNAYIMRYAQLSCRLLQHQQISETIWTDYSPLIVFILNFTLNYSGLHENVTRISFALDVNLKR